MLVVMQQFKPVQVEMAMGGQAWRRLPAPFLAHIKLRSKETNDDVLHDDPNLYF